MSESSRNRHCQNHLTDETRSSARKLVDALWQLNKDRLFEDEIRDDAIAHRSLIPRSSASTKTSKRSRTRSKISEADGKGSWSNSHDDWFSDMMSNGSTMEVRSSSRDVNTRCPGEKTIWLQDLYNSSIASRELVKLLTHIWGPGELNPSTVSLLCALRSELDLAHGHVRRLIKEQKSDSNEIEGLKKQLVEEVESWKSKQKENLATTLQLIISELEKEEKSRKRVERINKKLGTSLANTKASLEAATKELEKERKSRGRVEKICKELIRDIGEDKAEVEALRRETKKAQEELNREWEMLQLADEWREERVQMKLSDARYQFEEKNAAVDQLRSKLQTFLETKIEQEPTNVPCAHDQMHLSQASRSAAAAITTINKTREEEGGGDGEIDDSEGSDTRPIDFSMDGNSKSCSWIYTPPSKDTRRNVPRHNSFSESGLEGADKWGFDRKFEELEGDWDEGCSNGGRNFDHDEERYQAIKNLREQMLAGSAFIMSQDRANLEREPCGL